MSATAYEHTSKVEVVIERRNAHLLTRDEETLAKLGYKQEFKRAFTMFETFGLVFSIIGLFPSIASVLVYAIPNGGAVSMVWGWLVASLFLMTIALAMAELASAAPTSGGLYFWAHHYASPKWRNLFAWIVGYANTVGTIASVASIDWGCAVQIMAAATIGSPHLSFSPTTSQTFAVYLAIALSHVVVCCLGTAVLARLQNIYTFLNIALCLAITIVIPAVTPKEYHNTASYALGNFTNLNGWPNDFAFFLSWMSPVWTICSFDSSVHISEEATNAATAVPWSIVLATGVGGILGAAILIVLSFFMGTDMESIVNNPIGQPMATILFNSLGRKATLSLWAIVVIVQYMMGSSMLLASSRQTFAFSRDGALPFSRYLYRMNSFTGTPVNTVWFSGIGAALLGLLSFAGPAAISAIFSISVMGLYIAYSVPIMCRFAFRGSANRFEPGPFYLGRWGLPIAIVAVHFMAFINVIFLFPSTPHPGANDMNYSIVVMGSVLIFSLTWYYFPVYGGVNWFRGPIPTINPQYIGSEEGNSDTRQSDVALEKKVDT
ncbi:amino acid/polyamine transporter I [Cantharellus anzutake]|uniref:amino acid/polyamine transporter I n=1 Tax=Cantharellus anzutake TaxID=1750568 RepID=UPI001907E528|nr:amino acid/polyamine transporter I [Cantharellus anzutake]KAF8330575.1 amino acid/polyamine transporter I [Cantharellus anzutake]